MNTKIKILFMINNLYGGGAEKILQTLLGQLNPQKYDITLFGVKSEKFDNTLYPNHINYKSVFSGYNGKSFIKSFYYKIVNKIKMFVYQNFSSKLFYKLFIRGTYDVEVAFIEGYSTKIISGSNNNSTKICWVHIDLEANHWSNISYKSLAQEINTYKNYDHIISVSKSVQDAFSRKFGINDKLAVKYNPVDQKEIISKSKEQINDYHADDCLKLVTVGRLEPQKGYDRLIKVVNELVQEGFLFKLNIIGEGSQRKELESLITTFNLQEVVTLLGFKSNPYSYISKSDIFVCSSRSEGFSTVVTEALILGKPVVATDCSGMIELLGDSEYGLITKNDEKSLYIGLKEILTDTNLLTHYTKKSIDRSRDFDIKKTMKEVEQLWM